MKLCNLMQQGVSQTRYLALERETEELLGAIMGESHQRSGT